MLRTFIRYTGMHDFVVMVTVLCNLCVVRGVVLISHLNVTSGIFNATVMCGNEFKTISHSEYY